MANEAGGAKKPSPTEIAALVQAFAADPASDAYWPLAEAYLAIGRFMEAMVVCKKGIKARPADVAPRLLLARIYIEHGKEKKALDELKAATALQPEDVDALRTLAALQYKLGEAAASETLQKAHAVSPGDAGVLELMSQHGLAAPAPAQTAPPPPAPPEPPAPPQATEAFDTPTQRDARPGRRRKRRPPPPPPPEPVAAKPTAPPPPPPPEPVAAQPKASPPPPPPEAIAAKPKVSPPPPPPEAMAQRSADSSPSARHKETARRPAPSPLSARGGRHVDLSPWPEEPVQRTTLANGPLTTVVIFAVLLLTLTGWISYNRYKNGRDRDVTKLLRQAKEQLAKDTYQGYQEAEKDAQRVLDLDPTNFAAEAYVAYIDALRYGENGEGGDFLKQAQGALAKAKARNLPHAYIYAAEAYLAAYTGDPKAAEEGLQTVLHDSGSGQRSYSSDLLLGTLGIIQMGEGKLEEARKNLVDAHNLAPADVRITAVLGSLDARLDSVPTAMAFFAQALQIDPDHVASNLGIVGLELQANPPVVAAAEKQLDRLAKLGPGAMSPRQATFEKFLHAQLLYAQDKAGPAADEEKLALGLDPKNADMQVLMAQRLLRAGQAEQAIALFRGAVDLDPNRPVVLVDLGRAYLAEPDAGVPQAIQEFNLALAQLPRDARVMVLLGNALQKTGDVEGARAQWEKAVARDPDNLEAHAALAHYWVTKGDMDKTKAELTAVARRADGEELAEAVTELGKLAMAKGDLSTASDLFTKATQANDQYAPPYFYLGQVLLKDKAKKADGKKLLAKYLELAPTGLHAGEAKSLAGL